MSFTPTCKGHECVILDAGNSTCKGPDEVGCESGHRMQEAGHLAWSESREEGRYEPTDPGKSILVLGHRKPLHDTG